MQRKSELTTPDCGGLELGYPGYGKSGIGDLLNLAGIGTSLKGAVGLERRVQVHSSVTLGR